MVEGGEQRVLLDYVGRRLDVLLLDALDCPHGVRIILHLGLVNDPERATAHHLTRPKGTSRI